MKKILIAALFIASFVGVRAQNGSINFGNQLGGSFFRAPIFGPATNQPFQSIVGQGTGTFNAPSNNSLFFPSGTTDYTGCPLLTGSNFTLALFGGPTSVTNSAQLSFIAARPFRTGNAAGFINTSQQFFTNVPPGKFAKFQVRVWSNQNGAVPDWETAESLWHSGILPAGVSQMVTTTGVLGGIDADDNVFPIAADSIGWTSFNIYYLANSNPPPPSLLAGPIINPGNGHSYYLISPTNWPAAEAIAQSLGGHLATINNAAENFWVYTNFASFGGVSRTLWLGLTDEVREQTWTWVNGERLNFLNWASGEPNGTAVGGAGEDYAMMLSPGSGVPGTWNDAESNVLSAAVIELGAPEPPPPVILAGPVTNSPSGHRYYLLNYFSWPDAEQIAQSLGGHLATINDATENQWIFDTFANYEDGKRAMWIGLNDSVSEGTWTWISGAPVTYLNWAPGEPNSGAGVFPDEDHAVMWSASAPFPHGTWNDTGSNQLHSAIVEVGEPVPSPLSVFVQPTNVIVFAGSNATFSAIVTGGAPTGFQWRFNGTNLLGKTTNLLQLSNLQVADSGTYSVIVSTTSGSVTSNPALLTVNPPPPPVPPTITSQPTNLTIVVGNSATFQVSATGTTPFTYRWQFYGTNLSGTFSSVFTIAAAQFSHAGPYSVIVSNAGGSVTSSIAMLNVLPQAPCANVYSNLVSWWRAEKSTIDDWDGNNATAPQGLTTTAGKVGQAFQNPILIVPDAPSLRMTNALTIEAWVNPLNLSGTLPRTIVAKFDSPATQTNNPSQSSFIVGLTNNGRIFFTLNANNASRSNNTIVTSQSLVSNQWAFVVATYDGTHMRLYLNGALTISKDHFTGIFPGTNNVGIGVVPSTTSPVTAWPFVGLLDEVSLYNRALSANEILSIYQADTAGKCLQAPKILAQPQNQSVPLGEDAKFTATVVGNKPLGFQWRFNGTNLPGALTSSLVLERVRSNQAGLYHLFITNALGNAESARAQLTVLPPPNCTPTPEGLISWWPLDGDVNDAMDTNDGILEPFSIPPTAQFYTGKVDRALSALTGFKVADSPSLNFGSNANFSIEAWVKIAATTNSGPVPRGETQSVFYVASKLSPSIIGASIGYSFKITDGLLNCQLAAAAGIGSTQRTFTASQPDLRDSMFHHVALTLDRNSTNGGNLFIDGSIVLNFDARPFRGSLGSKSPVDVGYAISAGTLPGSGTNHLIDELAIYRRALSPTEILAIRNAGAAGKCKVPPSIVTQPITQHLTVGSNFTFSATAAGSPKLHYQWLINGLPIAGATNSSFSSIVGEFFPDVPPFFEQFFSVRVTNLFGKVTSSNAQLLINFPPAPMGGGVIVDEDQKITIFLFGSDRNTTDPLKVAIVTPPTHGTLGPLIQAFQPNGLVGVVDYTPAPNYSGPDSFTFKINDGLVDSIPAEIRITVTPVNDPPVASDQVVFLDEDTTTAINLSAADVDGDALTYAIVGPTHGTLTGTAPNLVYRPNSNYFGSDSFSFTVSDGHTNSNSASVGITVRSVNDAPIASFTITPLTEFPDFTNLIVLAPLTGNASVILDASGSSDVENDPLDFAWWEGTNNFANGMIVTNQFPPATHEVTLVVSDGQTNSEKSSTFEVLSPAQAVGLILTILDESGYKKSQPLIASLNGAAKAFERGNANSALNELKAFQNKVRAQVTSEDPVLAAKLLVSAQNIITALEGPKKSPISQKPQVEVQVDSAP